MTVGETETGMSKNLRLISWGHLASSLVALDASLGFLL